MLIGLTGKKRAGKTTVANHLVEKYNFHEISFADPLKKIIGEELLGLTPEQLFDPVKKEQVDPFWNKSPRVLLQLIGTDCFRNIIDPDFWVKLAEREITKHLDAGKNVVLSDVRFPNEVDCVTKLGGKMIHIIRLESSTTFDCHASETALDKYVFNYRIEAPSGDIESLCSYVDGIISAI